MDRKELFKLCEAYGADWNKKDANGVTALMKAAALNRVFFFDRLISLGADLNQKDNRGRTALDYAILFNVGSMEDRIT